MKHTSKLIVGSLSSTLAGKTIALCVTGSVAAVECVNLSRTLMRHGAEVYSVMSESAQKIIHPFLLEWATGNPVITELTGQIEHVSLAGDHPEHVDLVLVAPSTANTIGKIANGIDDTPVTTTVSSAIGAHIPVVIVPAMHKSLYDHPAVLANIQRLKDMGVRVVAPRMEEAKAKISSVEAVVETVFEILGPRDLVGHSFVVTAGPTRGWLDRVRFMTNPSTGKMGIETAKEIAARGGEVVLVLGPTSQPVPEHLDTIRVETAKEMLDSVLSSIADRKADVFISSAAVLDFEPEEREDRKRPSGESYTVRLVSTPKIIDTVRRKYSDLFIVGFKVESGVSEAELESKAREKILSGVCNLVVGNDERKRGVAFGSDTNEVVIVGEDGFLEHVPMASKRDVARRLIDLVVERLDKRRR
ncbi:MAG: bifunctional phosphopantothenoylcysteine decarboxylase/phosphopantothenate--cysteine ligase CoaBC [Candidatus Thorarchaeota archaeon]|nr:bifunctional phosphopantothenoylcysteine decarboxylase/phosphopantothenate--cysteine ligase CoaBC [Candidatus Thorarchaeota archaeon]